MLPILNSVRIYTPEEWEQKEAQRILEYLYTNVPQETLKEVLKSLLPALDEDQIDIVIHSRIAVNSRKDTL